jgi:predicted MFS family arabinose efflux permease
MGALSERQLVFLIGAVQFVNILDFVMVMPLGPDFAAALSIDKSQLGFIGGSYTAAAAVSGILGAFFLDRFDRKRALGVTLVGLGLGTLAGGLAVDLPTLMAARVLAGTFGGPATSLSYSIIADVVPAERRGKAIGALMGAFSAASVLGLPAGLELARHGGWNMPFFVVAGLAVAMALSVAFLLPPMRHHLTGGEHARPPFWNLLRKRSVLLSLVGALTMVISIFAIVPNLSAFVQFNAGYPRDELWILYLVGGTMNFLAARVAGGLVDRHGAAAMSAVGTAVFVTVLFLGFVPELPLVPIMALFCGFMIASAFRGVAVGTLSSRIPPPAERAAFMSLQSAVQHIGSAAGAFLSAQILSELPDGRLEGMPVVTSVSLSLAVMLPVFLWRVETLVRRDEEARSRADQSARIANP